MSFKIFWTLYFEKQKEAWINFNHTFFFVIQYIQIVSFQQVTAIKIIDEVLLFFFILSLCYASVFYMVSISQLGLATFQVAS